MYRIVALSVKVGVFIMISCSYKSNPTISPQIDNKTLEVLFKKDIEIRELDEKTDTVILENYDKVHRNKVFEMLAKNEIKTPVDKFRAALILQHTAAKICDGKLTSISSENFLLAYHLSSNALETLNLRNDTISLKKANYPRMVALNYDRYLLYAYGYQKFGTQFVFDEKTNEMILAPIDTTLSNDIERKKYNVESLEYLLKKYKLKPLTKE
jgi:hypothetical protein